jgi:hypothetical protein
VAKVRGTRPRSMRWSNYRPPVMGGGSPRREVPVRETGRAARVVQVSMSRHASRGKRGGDEGGPEDDHAWTSSATGFSAQPSAKSATSSQPGCPMVKCERPGNSL